MKINLSNIEEIIFKDDSIWSRLPRLAQHRGNWKLSLITPGLRDLGRRAFIAFMNDLRDDDIDVLNDHFGDYVQVERVSNDMVRTVEAGHEEIAERLCLVDGFSDFCVTADGNRVSVTFWR